jgi:hypothetical protein
MWHFMAPFFIALRHRGYLAGGYTPVLAVMVAEKIADAVIRPRLRVMRV